MPLVKNLDNEEYQHILLGGCTTLAERFAQIDEKMVQAELKRIPVDGIFPGQRFRTAGPAFG
jgi:hypothetical protein